MTERPGDLPEDVVAVLLAGGKGSRFWPASREAWPKQFLRLIGDKSLVRRTWERFASLLSIDRILIVANRAHEDALRREIPELTAHGLLLEPSGRDTAPAIALATGALRERWGDPRVVVAPTDHVIRDEAAFADSLRRGLDEAAKGALVTFGVVPTHAATGYGYIEVEEAPAAGRVSPVLRFHEKPSRPRAEAYLATKRFYWNAGIFAWRAARFEEELALAQPDLARALAGLPAPGTGPGDESAYRSAWDALPSISIDFALLEKASRVCVVPLNAGWSDVGSWDAVRELGPIDEEGNRPAEAVLFVDSRDSMVARASHTGRGESLGAGRVRRPRVFALVGVEGIIVVETEDAVLVCREGSGEKVREVVQKLRAAHREEIL